MTPTQKGFLLLSRKQKDLMAAIASNFGAKRDANGVGFGGSVEKTNAGNELRSIRLSTDRMVIAVPPASVGPPAIHFEKRAAARSGSEFRRRLMPPWRATAE